MLLQASPFEKPWRAKNRSPKMAQGSYWYIEYKREKRTEETKPVL